MECNTVYLWKNTCPVKYSFIRPDRVMGPQIIIPDRVMGPQIIKCDIIWTLGMNFLFMTIERNSKEDYGIYNKDIKLSSCFLLFDK